MRTTRIPSKASAAGRPRSVEADQLSELAVGVLLTQRTQTAVATLGNVSIPGAGTHNIQAAYTGDTNFSASTSTTIPLTASQIATTLQLASSSGAAAPGDTAPGSVAPCPA